MEGLCCVVTGGSSGLGLATVQLLSQRGAKVVFSCRTQAQVHTTLSTVTGLEVYGIAADAASETQKLLHFAVAKLGKIDVLVCNAALSIHKLAIETSDSELRRLFEVNVYGVLSLCKAALPYLKQSQHPSIVIVSSMSAYIGTLGTGAHSVTKAALLSLVKVLSLELIPYRIRVNGVAPGLFPNNHLSLDSAARAMILKRSPKEQPGRYEDAAALICYLSSPEASYLIGETVPVAGAQGFRL